MDAVYIQRRHGQGSYRLTPSICDSAVPTQHRSTINFMTYDKSNTRIVGIEINAFLLVGEAERCKIVRASGCGGSIIRQIQSKRAEKVS